MKDVNDVIAGALEILAEPGAWTKGSEHRRIRDTTDHGPNAVVPFNDHDDTIYSEVTGVLEKALVSGE